MKHPLCALALAGALTGTSACASFPFGETRIENPIASARSVDRQAYALLQTYAVVIEAATGIVRDPNAPAALKRALADAERAATPVAEVLGVSVRAYLAARENVEAAEQAAAAPSVEAAAALAIAAARLAEAVEAAQGPIGKLEALVRR